MASALPARVQWGTAASPAGKLAFALTEKNEICRVGFLRGQDMAGVIAAWRRQWPRTEFSGGAAVEDFSEHPVLLTGTPFQQAAWRVIAAIPAGRVITYGDIARRIGRPQAFRAVGAACGANPVPYVVPCHRVVAAHGKLGGFSGGLEIKKMLLEAEGFLRIAAEIG